MYTPQQLKRGEAIFARECVACHGSTLTDDELATPLVGEAFLAEWDDHSVGDLFERMRRTMPSTNPGALSAQEYADVLTLILSANKFPAGKTELQSEIEQLKLIRIGAKKPVAQPQH